MRLSNPSIYKNWKLDRSPEIGVFYALNESVSPGDLVICSKMNDKGFSSKYLDTENGYKLLKDIWIQFDSLDNMDDSDLKSLFIRQTDYYKLFFPTNGEAGGWGGNAWYRNKKIDELNKRRIVINKVLKNVFFSGINEEILIMYYGLLGEKRMSVNQIANFFRTNQSEIDKLLLTAIKELGEKGNMKLKELVDGKYFQK